MTFDLQRIIKSKHAYRRVLAQQPAAEKLAMLEALRDRTRTLRAAASRSQVDRLKALQAQTAAELGALLPAILDQAFKGEL